MPQTTYAKDISLYTLRERFGLQVTDTSFLDDWLSYLPELTDLERLLLKSHC